MTEGLHGGNSVATALFFMDAHAAMTVALHLSRLSREDEHDISFAQGCYTYQRALHPPYSSCSVEAELSFDSSVLSHHRATSFRLRNAFLFNQPLSKSPWWRPTRRQLGEEGLAWTPQQEQDLPKQHTRARFAQTIVKTRKGEEPRGASPR